MIARLDEATLRRLAEAVAGWTGFLPSAVASAAIERAVRALPATGAGELVARAATRDRALMRALLEAASCGETFFFRHPEHFRFIGDQVLPGFGGEVFRAWSAGCATGEEAYSLAACLEDHRRRRAGFRYEVLATDLLERNVELARAGSYRPWSVRPSTTGPLPYPLLEGRGDALQVRDELRGPVRFAVHNLLEPPPGGPFDLILCRNVLIYLAPEPARRVLAHLRAALRPEGVVLFAPVDLTVPFEGMHAVGAEELQAYSSRPRPRPARAGGAPAAPAPKVHAPAPRRPAPSRRPARSGPAPAVSPAPLLAPGDAHLAEHTRALRELERGEVRAAERVLEALVERAPGYLPGLLELALLWARQGRRGAAAELMREVWRRALALPGDAVVPGPEPLAAAYYLLAARSFIEGGRAP